MKLRNKLIPILSLATVSTVVAPIASSCGFTGYDKQETVDTLDITNPYTPSIAKTDAIGDEVSSAKALDIYMNHVMANPEILKQDIWYYESKLLPYRIRSLEWIGVNYNQTTQSWEFESQDEQVNTITDVVANITITDVAAKRHEAIIKGVKTEFYTIDMKLGYEFAFKASSLSTEPKTVWNQVVTVNTEYKDIPIYLETRMNLYSNAEARYPWYLSVNLLSSDVEDILAELPGWYFTYDINMGYTADVVTHGLSQTYSYNASANDTIRRVKQIYNIPSKLYEKGVIDFEPLTKKASSSIAPRNLLQVLQDLVMYFGSFHMSSVTNPIDETTFMLANHTQGNMANAVYEIDDNNNITLTPVADQFDLLKLGNGLKNVGDYIENVYIAQNGGSSGGDTPGEWGGDVRGYLNGLTQSGVLELTLDEDYYKEHPTELPTNKINAIVIDPTAELTKSSSITEHKWNASKINFVFDGETPTKLPESFNLKFKIEDDTMCNIAYNLLGKSQTTTITNYEPIEFWVHFSKKQ